MNGITKHTIPRHAHAKAIAYFCRIHECSTYPLREINGMHGGLIRTLDRKKPVAGMRVYFESRNDGFSRHSSILRFERTH
jgi:hypothetical protein